MGYVLSLVKEWAKENWVTEIVMGLIVYQNLLQIYPDWFPKSILGDPHYPDTVYAVFICLIIKFIYPIIKNWNKDKQPWPIWPERRVFGRIQKVDYAYSIVIDLSHFIFDFISIVIFLVYLFPLLVGTVSGDLKKIMIFADFYGLVVVPYIVSLHFGIKISKRNASRE